MTDIKVGILTESGTISNICRLLRLGMYILILRITTKKVKIHS